MMKAAFFTVFGLLLCFSALSALGYTSAYVETERDMEAAAAAANPSTAGGAFNPNEGAKGLSMEVSEDRSSFSKAQETNFAMPAIDPLTDTTTKLIYSLMDTIFLRFKQQLFISSVSQWKDELLKSDIQYLFPNLANLLVNIESSNFLGSYDLWKTAIDKDLQETPLGIMNFTVSILGNNEQLTPEEKSLLFELRNLLGDVYTFRNITNLDDFIQVATVGGEQHSQLFKLIGIIAKNMLDEDGNIIVDDIKDLSNDPEFAAQYVRNVQRDINDLMLNDDEFQLTAGNLKFYLDSCKTVQTFVTKLSSGGEEVTENRMGISEYVKLYFGTCEKLIVQWSNMLQDPDSAHNWELYYQLFTKYRFKLQDVTQLIEQKRYKNLINVMITTALSIAEDHNYIPISYSRFLNLISAIALSSENGEVDYRRIMDSILEPVGSYAYKRQAGFSVLLNSYPGFGGGAETLGMSIEKPKAVAGLSCPVGLELNWGANFTGFSGIFLSAFDLGAVATYRFAQGDTLDSNSPQIGWKQLVSPGFYFLIQQKNHPITIGVGMQMTPQLRKVSVDGNVKDENALRFGAFLSMDIPVFTFYVKHNWLKESGNKLTKSKT
jgi:hypothetical protein